jgi:uracil-DNA glycosylase family 4
MVNEMLTPSKHGYRSLKTLQKDLRDCQACAEAGYFVGSHAIFSGEASARLMLIAQAPGSEEPKVGYPFAANAGRRLFDWLAKAGWDEATFRATCYMTSVTKCFPGPHPSGRGDRVPTRKEQELCRQWLEAELGFVAPEVVVTVGGVAMRLFHPPETKLDEIVGTSIADGEGREILSLPHPSGASSWLYQRGNLGRLEQALWRLRTLKEDLDL